MRTLLTVRATKLNTYYLTKAISQASWRHGRPHVARYPPRSRRGAAPSNLAKCQGPLRCR